MSCPINKDAFNTKAFNELRNRPGFTENLFDQYIGDTILDFDVNGNPVLTKEFSEYLKEKDIKDFDINDVKSADIIYDFTRQKHLGVNFIESMSDTSDRLKEIVTFGYSNADARAEAIQTCVVLGLSFLDKVRRIKKRTVKGDIKTHIRNGIESGIIFEAARRIAKVRGTEFDFNTEEGKALVAEIRKQGVYLVKQELSKEPSIVNSNFIALFSEAVRETVLNPNTGLNEVINQEASDNFFRKVLVDARFAELNINVNDEFKESQIVDDNGNEIDEDQEFYEENSEDRPVDSSTDDTISQFEHSGTKPSFLNHVAEEIKTYFYTLPKLLYNEKSDGKWITETGKYLGMPATMDASECISILYHEGDFTNWESMINSISRIAERYQDFASFAKLAEDLKNDTDFCFAFYNTFGKQIMSKIETVVDDGSSSTNQSNKRSNKRTALLFDMLNSVRSSAVTLGAVNQDSIIAEIMPSRIALSKINSPEARTLIEKLSNIFSAYFTTLDKYTISSFITEYQQPVTGEVNVYKNYETLYNLIKRVIESGAKTAFNHEVRRAKAAKKHAEIRRLKETPDYNFKTLLNLQKELQDIYNEEYIEKELSDATTTLADVLAPYSSVSVDLNSRNVYGNLSSDVLNNSMITNLLNTLQNSLNNPIMDARGKISYPENCPLMKYMEFKLGRSSQYIFSNILIERVENGEVIKGLFRKNKDGNGYYPTPYARDLLNIELFTGATSFDTSKNILYSEMSSIDYLTTAFLNFRHSGKEGVGKYFMRVPSDASKTFIVTAPKYSIDGLIKDGVVNTNHILFRQLRNSFKQELLDMAVALYTIFEVDENGVILRDGDKPIIKEKYLGEGKNKLYKIYHYIKDIIETKNGEERLTGRVFQSTKFTVFDDEIGEQINYGQNIVDEAISLLYGGVRNNLKVVRDNSGRIVDVDTTAYDDVINKHLSDFVTAYIKEATKRILPARTFIYKSDNTIKEDAQLYNAVAEFALNTHLMYINFDDLFEGDSRFYKDSQDFLKRAKEVQGAGTPYGVVDYNSNFIHTVKTKIPGVLLNDEAALRTFGRTVGVSEDVINKLLEIGQYDTFSAVTVENTVRPIAGTEVNSNIEKALAKGIAKKGVSAAQAKEQARKLLDKFNRVKVNDAQSYITFEEWVRRVSARGQLGKYLPLISKILDETQELTSDTIEEFIQVQKNFYYDLHYDDELNIIVPRQIKNAEFVLVPRFIEGTELEQVYNIMKENGIDQLNTEETSKAGKHNVLTLWDNEGKLDARSFGKDVFDKTAIELYTYNNLYTQQETPQHVNAENKAGIQVMKKILDNIPADDPKYETLRKYKSLFMKLYSTKIYKAFYALMTELNVPRNENGGIIVDVDGTIKGLNYELFYEKFREQAERLGNNTNLNDYLTLEPIEADGIMVARMPNFFNGTSNRVESIAQAVFNNSITRQKLPGFHAAQITGIGWTRLGTKKSKNIGISKQLRYHTDKDGNYVDYIEIMLPASAFNFAKNPDGTYVHSAEERLQQLQDAGLDEVIGYRIPTEGKQSVCIMKVVNFIDDACGSTIVVPDGWVGQTGSDFDIDSIYGIQYATYLDKDKKIQKVKYKDSLTDEEKLNMWKRYIRKSIKEDITNVWSSKDKRIKKAIDVVRKQQQKHVKELNVVFSESFENLSEREKSIVRRIHTVQNRKAAKLDAETLGKLIENEISILDRVKNKTKELQAYMKALSDIVDYINVSYEEDAVAKTVNETIESLRLEDEKIYDEYAKSRGLMTFAEYKSQDNDFIQSEDAINNGIVEAMLSILGDELTIEELLSTSNFDDIIDARDGISGVQEPLVSPKVKKERASRSVYNIFDQAEFMGDATSGLKLKGFSVTRDNLCSICNTAKAYIIDSPLHIAYPKSKYSKHSLEKHFGKVKEKGDYYIVKHDRIGWSNDNKNVDGAIITVYSSETTAHILDAIKAGNIPNVNDYSFGIYKTFVDVGSNYETAVGFMMQPAVTLIVDQYNKNKSVYSDEYIRPIVDAFKILADKTLPGFKVTNRTTVKKLIDALNRSTNVLSALETLTGTKCIFSYEKGVFHVIDGKTQDVINVPINIDELRNRINNKVLVENTPVEESILNKVYDLLIAVKFSELQNLSQDLTSHAQVLNPDKFGAKQTIFATSKVFDDINDIIKYSPRLTVEDGRSLLEAIYPGISEGVESFAESPIKDSVYSPLYYFLKYSSAPAVIINRNLFETQQFGFREAVKCVRRIFGRNIKINEKIYKDFEKHLLGYLYNEIEFVKNKVNYNKEKGTFDIDYSSDPYAESQRIRGFNADSDVSFDVKDFYNPNDDEIAAWGLLTPAQKVFWLQSHLEDAGIFKYLRVDLQNKNRGRNNAQTIEFKENTISIEDIYTLFSEAYRKKNPLIRLVVADLIKYAFQVEGYRMTQSAMNKIIQNDALMDSVAVGGTGIVSSMREAVKHIESRDIQKALSTYVRSKTVNEVAKVNISKSPLVKQTVKEVNGEITTEYSDNWYMADATDQQALVESGLAYYDSNGNLNIVSFFVTKGKEAKPYAVYNWGDYITAYPLNKLEANEYGDWSANPLNNIAGYNEQYYLGRIKGTISYEERKNYGAPIVKTNIASNTLDLNKPKNDAEQLVFERFKSHIASAGDRITTKNPIYVWNTTVSDKIIKTKKSNGSVVTIDDVDYIVYKLNLPERLKKYLIGGEKESIPVSSLPLGDKLFADVISQLRSVGFKSNSSNVKIVGVVKATEEDSPIIDFDTMNSSIEEAPIHPISNIIYEASQGNKLAEEIKNLFDKLGINSDTRQITVNVEDTYQLLRNYVTKTIEELEYNAKYFVQDDDGNYLSIKDSKAIDLIRNDKEQRIKYLKLLLDSKKLISIYDEFSALPKDNPEIATQLDAIKRAIDKLKSSMFDDAWLMFANDYLKKLSTNPLVQKDIITLLDGYYESGIIEALINDTQEMPNPLIQVITKEVMADIRARDLNAEVVVNKFRTDIQKIIDDAKKAGVKVDWDKIIDNRGRIINDFTQQFIDDYANLKKHLTELAADPKYGEGSVEYLKAELELDKWLRDNVEQVYAPGYTDEIGVYHKGYYDRMIELKEHMLKNHADIYSAYRKLLAERNQLRTRATNENVDPAVADRLEQVNKEISNLSSEYISTGYAFYAKPSIKEADNPVDSKEEAVALKNYLKSVRDVYAEFQDSEENIGFREELERKLKVIEAWEARDAASRLTTHPIVLEEIPEYMEAKKWVKQNARFIQDEDTIETINKAFSTLGTGTKSASSVLLRNIVKTLSDYYDEYGRGDGTKLNSAQQRSLRDSQDAENANKANSPFNATRILNSAGDIPFVFTKAFYLATAKDAKDSSEFVRIIKELNNILRKHYDVANKRISWANVTEAEYTKLKKLYERIAQIKDKMSMSELAQNSIEWSDGQEAFDAAYRAARLGDTIDLDLWLAVNTEIITLEDGTQKTIPNRFIYCYQRPTEAGMKLKNKFGKPLYIDEAKTEALNIIKGFCVTEPTIYYYRELERRRQQELNGETDADGRTFQEWYDDNHTYNPINGAYSPIKCWMQSTIVGGKGNWEAAFRQKHSTPKKEHRNPNHREGLTLGSNYRKGGKYDAIKTTNEYEDRIKNVIYNILIALSKNNPEARRFFEKGHLPIQTVKAEKNYKYYLKELAKLTGWIEGTEGNTHFDESLDYNTDVIPTMPMTRLLEDLEGIQNAAVKPERKNYDTTEEYNAALLEYQKIEDAKQKEIDDLYKKMLDRNWVDVISEFIYKAEHYNAIQDNKYMLYYGQCMLRNMSNFITYTGNDNLTKSRRSSKESREGYQTKDPRREYDQYTNWMRRLIRNEWRKPNKRFNKIASIAQSFTSANFMMMNIRGGIANVTLGETQIMMEAAAGEYITGKDWAAGSGMWLTNVSNMVLNRHKETSTSVADAFRKFMDVIDFDEIRGVPTIDLDPSTYLTRLRNFMFSPQTVGENFMQNSVLFAMAMSHKLYKNDTDGSNGRTSYIVKGRADVIRDAHEDALLELLDDAQRKEYEDEKKRITSDPNITKEYAWYKLDLVTTFVRQHLNKEQQSKFIEIRAGKEKEALKEFDAAPSLWEQLALVDGKLSFADGSILQQLNVSKDGEPSEAYRILGEFKGKVISVNKKIHGVYDKLGAAQIENNWWGSLVMQYHKHIVPNVLKRWRRHGYYNEERGTIEKGCHIALLDFLAIPFQNKKKELGISDGQADMMESIQETFKDIVDFCINIGHYYKLLPAYEQANIRRNLGDIIGVMSAICFAIALRALWDDDDEDNRLYNLALYECDRLASETMQFNPLGAFTEAKKLWSNPVAVQSIINDIMSSAGIISQMLMEGEDFDPYYQSGKYAGQHKLAVRIRRRIPIWRGIDTIINIADDNHYYKLGDNMLSIVPIKRIAEWINE